MQAPLLEIHNLQGSGEIGVTFQYDEEVKESLKQAFGPREGRSWDPDSKMWKFPAELFEQVKAWALGHFDEALIRLPGQVKLVLSCFISSDSRMVLRGPKASLCGRALLHSNKPHILPLLSHESAGPCGLCMHYHTGERLQTCLGSCTLSAVYACLQCQPVVHTPQPSRKL